MFLWIHTVCTPYAALLESRATQPLHCTVQSWTRCFRVKIRARLFTNACLASSHEAVSKKQAYCIEHLSISGEKILLRDNSKIIEAPVRARIKKYHSSSVVPKPDFYTNNTARHCHEPTVLTSLIVSKPWIWVRGLCSMAPRLVGHFLLHLSFPDRSVDGVRGGTRSSELRLPLQHRVLRGDEQRVSQRILRTAGAKRTKKGPRGGSTNGV